MVVECGYVQGILDATHAVAEITGGMQIGDFNEVTSLLPNACALTTPMERPMTKGFAIVSFGDIDVTTVSPTRRGAIVNWLVTSARRMIFQWTTDEEIERHWRECRGSHKDHDVVEVSIAPIAP